jgi:hypothetical protein
MKRREVKHHVNNNEMTSEQELCMLFDQLSYSGENTRSMFYKCIIDGCNNEITGRKFKYCDDHSNKDVTCEHGKESICKVCNPVGHLCCVIRSRIRSALKREKAKHSMEYLGCDIDSYRSYLEEKFKDGMSWDNYGEWHIDHIVPLKYRDGKKEVNVDVIVERLHYTNTQPLWAKENMAKGNRYCG